MTCSPRDQKRRPHVGRGENSAGFRVPPWPPSSLLGRQFSSAVCLEGTRASVPFELVVQREKPMSA